MAAVALMMTTEELEDAIRRAVEPLRAEVAKLQEARAAEASLLTLDEAARVLGVSRRTVQRMVASGRAPSTHVGRAVRVDVSGLLPREE